MTAPFWTPARVEQLRAWWTSGRRSSGEIAREWGVSRNRIMGKIKRLGLNGQGPPPGGGWQSQWTAEQDAEATKMWLARKSASQIARVLGTSMQAVKARVRRLGLAGKGGGVGGPKSGYGGEWKNKRAAWRDRAGGKGPMTAHLPGDGKFKGTADWRKMIERVEPTTPDSTRELRGCRWIDGDVLSGDWRYCQAETPFGSSWCREHHARVFLPGTAFDARKVRAA